MKKKIEEHVIKPISTDCTFKFLLINPQKALMKSGMWTPVSCVCVKILFLGIEFFCKLQKTVIFAILFLFSVPTYCTIQALTFTS